MKNILVLSIAFVFAAANITWRSLTREVEVTSSTPVQIDRLPGSCPYLTKDPQANEVLSWVRAINDSTSMLCYAVSADGGKTFGDPIEIPSSSNVHAHSENVPKLVFKPSGEIIAVWGGHSNSEINPYAGNIFYSQSFDNGNTWTEATPLVSDTAGYDQRYFDIHLTADGEAAIIWLDNRKSAKAEGSALYFAKSRGKDGFKNERKVAEGTCQCCRTDLYIDKQNAIHVLYRSILKDSIRDIVHSVSIDDGQSFSRPRRISNDNWVLKGCPHTGPSMTANDAGLHLAWFTGGTKKGSFYTSTKNKGASFTGEDSIGSAAKHPQISSLQNGKLVTVWDELVKKDFLFTSRIGVQLRTADGKSVYKNFVSPDDLPSTYPVVTSTTSGAALTAYCISKGNKKYIAYQHLEFR